MTEYIHTNNYHWLKLRTDNSIDSIVTDSPYGLGKEPDASVVLRDWLDHGYHEIQGKGFMGKHWDAFVPQPILWKEAYRVLKPGGYLLSFFGTRTYDWGVMALRLAGFEIRDQIAWVYSTGFPKSSNQHGDWEGWGSALKPAMEPIVVARKPLIGSIPENMAQFGTGALNIDACRVQGGGEWHYGNQPKLNGQRYAPGTLTPLERHAENVHGGENGRWPANLIHDGSDEVIELFPDSAGQLAPAKADGSARANKVYGKMKNGTKNPEPRIESNKSASRFFYCAKPSPEERNKGLENMPKKVGGLRSNTSGQHITRRDGGEPQPVGNFHPTIKPIALMRYLVRLVTHRDGICLDLFAGSGTTGMPWLVNLSNYQITSKRKINSIIFIVILAQIIQCFQNPRHFSFFFFCAHVELPAGLGLSLL